MLLDLWENLLCFLFILSGLAEINKSKLLDNNNTSNCHCNHAIANTIINMSALWSCGNLATRSVRLRITELVWSPRLLLVQRCSRRLWCAQITPDVTRQDFLRFTRGGGAGKEGGINTWINKRKSSHQDDLAESRRSFVHSQLENAR